MSSPDAAASGRPPDPSTVPLRFRPPVTLTGLRIDLVPLDAAHVAPLAVAGRSAEVWQYLRIGPGRTPEEMRTLVAEMLRLQDEGSVLPFAVIDRARHQPIGMFRFLDIDRENRGVELGTWLDPSTWRTPVNTEVKYLGLRYAFEEEGCHRVQLRTDSRNARSQRAIERLGAVREGVHREHLRLGNGVYRTSVVYSLLAAEWPAAKRALEEKLGRPWSGAAPPVARP